jgi:cell division protein ZapB
MMDESDLKKLEQRVDQLIEAVAHLQDENRSLRNLHSDLVNERDELLEKTELARGRVEAMISRLRDMENGA